MSRFAIFADFHFPNRSDTVKEPVFDWALSTADALQVDYIICAGDVTSLGTAEAARRLRQKFGSRPLLITPGNAELRTAAETAECLAILATEELLDEVVLLDTSAIRLSEASRALLNSLPPGRQRLAVTHCPHHYLPDSDQQLLQERLADGAIATLVSGHIHRDVDNGAWQVVRGLDPDKAIGGPPGFTIMDNSNGTWQRQDFACPFADPTKWPEAERHDWLSWLGISGMKDTLTNLSLAAEHQVPAFEIRANESKSIEHHVLADAVSAWRRRGGQYLSIHLQSISMNENGQVRVPDDLPASVELACRLQARSVTIHVPGVVLGQLLADQSVCETLLDSHEKTLRPLVDAGITISVENMHLRRGEPCDEQRLFGYTPSECRQWITAMRQRLGEATVGFQLDIGHARNNHSLASLYNVSEWYAELGSLATGYHLHQFAVYQGKGQGHCAMKEFFGHSISLSSFMLAWQRRQLNHAPMFLEIRTEPPMESYLALKQLMTK